MNRQERMEIRMRRSGFTLIELLVVILIILLVSAVTLPTVIPAITHRQVSEAARILQGALAGARDTAINNNAPAGIRLLVDPVFNGINPSTGQLDATRILACNRFIPIQLAPDYLEGRVTWWSGTTPAFTRNLSYNLGSPPNGGVYPVVTNGVSVIIQSYYGSNGLPNPPTSWNWNVRLGDKIQINNTGPYLTVVGPMDVVNPELFVNLDPTLSAPLQLANGVPIEFLFVVNGVDDNHDGYIDNGWDGIDNDGDGYSDNIVSPNPALPSGEWIEVESRPATFSSALNVPYTITRRPTPSPGSRETLLPSNVVVDLTTWNAQFFGVNYVSERSRLPVDPTTGYVDILLNPNGTVVPTTEYSSPSSFGMDSAFYHFWLAERGDLFDPVANPNIPYLLPMVPGSTYPGGTPYPFLNDPLSTRALKGERRLMTLFTRTGQLITNQVETFDATPLPPVGLGPGPNFPFLGPQQGIRGDTR